MTSSGDDDTCSIPEGSPPLFWGDELSDNVSDNVSDDKPISYVFAHHRAISTGTADPPVLIVLSPTKRGWGSRSTSRHYFNHDYVCYETFEQVYEWLKLECARPFVTQDREEALELLSAPSPSSGGFLRTGCFECNPMMGEVERAERVLRHLEL